MDGRYPGSGFEERRDSSGETADWAYSSSTAVSSSYSATHMETELLHRQSYTSSNNLPTYTTSHHPTGVSGVFDTSLHNSASSTTESSIMNFLASIESRGLQAGPAATSILPQFRTSPWQTGTNSSTELFLTGALPSSGTFSTMSGLSSYQHPSTFPTRSFGTASALGVQHTTYSPSNGLLSPNDPLLQIKPSHTTVPTAFAFDRLSGASLGTSLPVQSSTYRSAQESAPHLLQPQFSLLPSALASSQQTTQAYGAPIFSSSLERALQRECSVIKHHQRPSSTQPALSASAQHSLQTYLPDDTDSSFQNPSRHTPVPNSPSGIPNGTAQQKPQTNSPSVPSPAYSSTSEVKDDSNQTAEHLEKVTELHDQVTASHLPQHRYASISQKQSSEVANQSQAYTSAQLTSLMSVSPAQTYIASQSLSSNNDVQVFSPSQSENVSSVSQALIFSSGQEQILSSAANTEYNEQVQDLCMGNPSHSYSSSHSQGVPTVSYYGQGLASVSLTKSYSSAQSLPNSSPYSSRPHSLATTQDYHLMEPTPSSKSDGHLVQQPPKYSPVQSASSSTATYTQPLQSNQSSAEQKRTYSQRKPDENGFVASKDSCGELPLQDVQALQQASTQTDSNSNVRVQSNIVYVVSKTDDRQVQSVIRSNSRSEDQLTPVASKKHERTLSDHVHLESGVHSHGTKDSSLTQSSQLVIREATLLLKSPSVQSEIHQIQSNRIQQQDQRQVSQEHAQFVQLPSGQVLLDPSQKILLQQPLLATEPNQSKAAVQMQPVSVQFLPLNNEILNSSVGMRGTLTHQAVEIGKQPMVQKDHFSSTSLQDAKQHFALSSICFPESMLMADEKTILSNMDDILAATAAACGVTPQDFKTSEGDLAAISNPTDTKCHYQLVGNQHDDGFSSQHMMGNAQTLTLNGGQLITDLHKGAGEQQAFTSTNSHKQQGNSKQDMSEQMVERCDKNETLSKEIPSNESLNSNGHNHSDYHPAAQEYTSTAQEYASTAQEYTSTGLLNQPKGVQCDKMEEDLTESLSEGLSKKRAKSKGSSKQAGDDQNGQPKSQKRSGQVKRQNSKGSETSSSSDGYLDGYQQQERIRQIIKEVEEKQPEVKTGFIGSFLDFLKSGPKQNFFSPPIRSPSRTKKPPVSKKPNLLPVPPKPLPSSTQSVSADIGNVVVAKKVEEELQKNLQPPPTFSSDEEESVRKNQDLQKSISCALSSLDETTDKKLLDSRSLVDCTDQGPPPSGQSAEIPQPVLNEVPVETLLKDVPPNKLAVRLNTVAVEGLTDDELTDSGGEGMYRERDEFVVRNEDIESLQITLKAGVEPPAIWKVQKALLQKFTPELRDGKRVFSATNSYLGYFGDAKTMYRRVYVKFLDTVNKREYVRVCNRKPKCKPMHSMRGSQMKAQLTHKPAGSLESDSSTLKQNAKQGLSKPRPKQPKSKAEPPPKKRKKWKEEFTVSPELASDPEAVSEDDEFTPPVPFATRFLNTRTMKETFKCFVELLISVALDANIMITLERENDELLLPHMKRVDGMITDNRRRLLPKLHVGQVFKNALDSFPELSVVTELKTDGETPTFKIRLSGKAYNKKTMKPAKSHIKVPPEYTVEQQKTHWFSLYHSLQHYKYHTYLLCMKEIALLRSRGVNLGQEEMVQTCMGNQAWVEGLFDRFGELLTQVQQACL